MCEGRHGDLGEKKSGRSKGSGANAPQGRYTGSFGVRSVKKKNVAVKIEKMWEGRHDDLGEKKSGRSKGSGAKRKKQNCLVFQEAKENKQMQLRV